MAGTLRRGLPRTPGGQPWPPADIPVPAAFAETAAPAVASAPAAASEAPVAAPTAAPAPAPVTPPPAAEGPAVTAPAASAPAATLALRRGLPRVPGGEPWPPASAAPAGAAASAAAAPTAAPPAPAAAEPAPTSAPTPAAPPAPPRVAAAGETVSVRRGLPRVPGGEPWPPVDTVARTVTADAEPVEAVAAAVAPGEPAAAPAAVPAPVDAGPRAPLPFPRTVWPGAAARGPRGPRPEPQRIGPFTRAQWLGIVVVLGGGLLIAAGMAVALVRWLLSTQWGGDFLAAFPGEYHLPEGAPVGFPAWLGWQHFFNAFLIILIIRSGLQVRREKRPSAFWTPRWNSKRKISLALWFHQSLDILWLLNGVVFLVLLFVTGQWMRIVPTSWEVIPNAISAGLQYVSLDWPTENGWVNYNSLQQIAYFLTVFVAAPLAAVTGVRMSGIWPSNAKTLNRIYPIEVARKIHFPVMIYFCLFILAHVALVFATGALRNLNHMYAAQDAVNWTGFWIFVVSIAVTIGALVAARPMILAPIARLFGSVSSR